MCKLLSSNKNGHVFALISYLVPVSRDNVCLWCSRVFDWHMMTDCSRKREAETSTGWPPQWYGRKQKTKCLQRALSLYGPTMSTDVLLKFLSGVLVTLKLYSNTNRELYVNTFLVILKTWKYFLIVFYDMIWNDMIWCDVVW